MEETRSKGKKVHYRRNLQNEGNLQTCTSFDNGVCICESGYYPEKEKPQNTNDKNCHLCQPNWNCLECSSAMKCSSCEDGKYLDSSSCKDCSEGCAKCDNTSLCTECTNIESMELEGGVCKCMDGYFLSGDLCIKCNSDCLICTSSSYCKTCADNSTPIDGKCSCPSGTYLASGSTCKPCGELCIECDAKGCTKCSELAKLDHGECTCPENSKKNSSNLCKCDPKYYQKKVESTYECSSCVPPCVTCTSSTFCLSCVNKYQKANSTTGECEYNCPEYYYQINETCDECPELCISCKSKILCTDCRENSEIKDDLCKCSFGYYLSWGRCNRKKFKFSSSRVDQRIFIVFNESLYHDLEKKDFPFRLKKRTQIFLILLSLKQKLCFH